MYRRILVVVDDKPAAHAAVVHGTALAAVHGAEVVYVGLVTTPAATVTDAIPYPVVPPEALEDAIRERIEELLADAKAAADEAGVMAHTTSAAHAGDPRHICEIARRRRCDLIVVGSEDRNAVLRLITGSLVPGLITASPVPVLVCKAAAQEDATMPRDDLPAGAMGMPNEAPGSGPGAAT